MCSMLVVLSTFLTFLVLDLISGTLELNSTPSISGLGLF